MGQVNHDTQEVLEHRVRFDALLLYALRHWPTGEAYSAELLDWLHMSGERERNLNRVRAGLYRLKADGFVVGRFEQGRAGGGIGRTYYRAVEAK